MNCSYDCKMWKKLMKENLWNFVMYEINCWEVNFVIMLWFMFIGVNMYVCVINCIYFFKIKIWDLKCEDEYYLFIWFKF